MFISYLFNSYLLNILLKLYVICCMQYIETRPSPFQPTSRDLILTTWLFLYRLSFIHQFFLHIICMPQSGETQYPHLHKKKLLTSVIFDLWHLPKLWRRIGNVKIDVGGETRCPLMSIKNEADVLIGSEPFLEQVQREH